MTNLLELAAKVEAAEGPSFALDCKINKAVGSAAWPPPAYTSSVDAAMMLVPKGWSFGAGTDDIIPGPTGWAWVSSDDDTQIVKAATPALALTAASLRARSENPA